MDAIIGDVARGEGVGAWGRVSLPGTRRTSSRSVAIRPATSGTFQRAVCHAGPCGLMARGTRRARLDRAAVADTGRYWRVVPDNLRVRAAASVLRSGATETRSHSSQIPRLRSRATCIAWRT